MILDSIINPLDSRNSISPVSSVSINLFNSPRASASMFQMNYISPSPIPSSNINSHTFTFTAVDLAVPIDYDINMQPKKLYPPYITHLMISPTKVIKRKESSRKRGETFIITERLGNKNKHPNMQVVWDYGLL